MGQWKSRWVGGSVGRWSVVLTEFTSLMTLSLYCIQGFGREKDENRRKRLCTRVVIFCYKEFQNFP